MARQLFLAYKITCTVNGKGYIGITIRSLARRWAAHRQALKSGSTRALYRAMRKYGFDAFHIESVACAFSLSDLRSIETDLIVQHGTHVAAKGGYNRTFGGETPGPWQPSEEVRARFAAHIRSVRPEPRRGADNHNAKAIVVEGVAYPTFREAAKAHGVSHATVCNWRDKGAAFSADVWDGTIVRLEVWKKASYVAGAQKIKTKRNRKRSQWTCSHCGKEFRAARNPKRSRRVFCSRWCSGQEKSRRQSGQPGPEQLKRAPHFKRRVVVGETEYESMSVACAALNIHFKGLRRLILSGDARYLTPERAPRPKAEQATHWRSIAVEVEGIEYPTITAATAALHIDRKGLDRRIKDGRARLISPPW